MWYICVVCGYFRDLQRVIEGFLFYVDIIFIPLGPYLYEEPEFYQIEHSIVNFCFLNQVNLPILEKM